MSANYRTEETKSYYAIKYRFKNSKTAVRSAAEYKSIAETESKARKLSNFDMVHYYEVVYITHYDIYINEVFIGCKTNELSISNWFCGEDIGF